LEALGWLANERGDMEVAAVAAKKGLKLGTLVEIESTRKASFLRILGSTARIRGDLELAKERYEESLALSRQAGDMRGIAHALITLGWAASTRGDTSTRRYSMRRVWSCPGSWAARNRSAIP
jgi:hypothetical protein